MKNVCIFIVSVHEQVNEGRYINRWKCDDAIVFVQIVNGPLITSKQIIHEMCVCDDIILKDINPDRNDNIIKIATLLNEGPIADSRTLSMATKPLNLMIFKLLIHGYVRRVQKSFKIQIPKELFQIISSFYPKAKLLPFSKEYKGKDCLVLLEDDTKLMHQPPRPECMKHRHALIDIEPLKEGVHCFRVAVYNPGQTDQIFWGFSERWHFSGACFTGNTVTAWGQVSNGWSRRQGKFEECDGFQMDKNKIRYQIDMLLNCDEGTLAMGPVFDKDLEKSSGDVNKLVGMSEDIMNGVVPHFSVYKDGTCIQVAYISPDLFMQSNEEIDKLFASKAKI